MSVLKSLTDLASVGLEPGTGPTALAYLVPFRGAGGAWEAQPVIGYRGYINLARRSGLFLDLHATVVHEHDTFDLQLGSAPHVLHKPFIQGDRGQIIGAYCVSRFVGGGMQIEFMTRHDIERIRDKFSKSAKNGGPWRDTFDAMAVKTVIRKAAKHWPLSTELQAAITMDAGVVTPGGHVIDAVADYVPDAADSAAEADTAGADSAPPPSPLAAAQARAQAILSGKTAD